MTAAFGPDDKLHLTNLNKVFWPDLGYTKRDLLDYYQAIAPVMLPYLVDRPQVLHRHVDGHTGKEFYQRVSRKTPAWMKTVEITLEDGRRRDYHLCQDWPTLLWLANFGCIELSPWSSRVDALDRPDYAVIDLDPIDVPFPRVVEVANAVRKVIDVGATGFCKTSGQRGLHIYLPLGRQYTYEQAMMASKLVTTLVNRELPALTSLDPLTKNRQGMVYLDTTRNSRGQVMAAAYSARPFPGATVSAPLRWSELTKRLDPTKFTIKTMPGRVERVGDLWQGVLGPGIDLASWIQQLENRRGKHSK
jgi:bifunctional non-homologous end joining protein LigD